MQITLSGSLHRFPAGEVLALLGANGHGGLLEMESDARRTRVWLRGGKVAWGETNDDSFALVALLSRYGLLTKEQLDTVKEKGTASGVATPEHLTFYVTEIVVEAFTWSGGRFTFQDEAALPAGATELAIDHVALIEEGERRAEDARRIAQLYPDENQHFRVVDDLSGQVSLTSEQFRILMRLGVGRSLAEVCRDLKKPEGEVYPLVQYLEERGLIVPIAAAAPEAAPEPPKEEPKPAPARDEAAYATVREPLPKPPAPPPPPPPEPPPQPTPTPAPATIAGKQPVPRRTLVGSLTGDGPSPPCYPLMEDEYTIGRDPSNKISIRDGSVSSRHARVLRTTEGFVIEDLKSRNGTFVNGEPVKEKRVLVDNDLIRVGKVILTFKLAKEQKPVDITDAGER